MRGLPQKQNARRADKIRLCGHLGRYKKIVKKTYIIYVKPYCKNKVKLFPSFFLVKSVFHNWHEHNYQDYPHIPSQASVLALPFPENN